MATGCRGASWSANIVRVYLNVKELAELTPWTPKAIKRLVERGIFLRGKHYFQLRGHRDRLIFKWPAIVELIEGPSSQNGGVGEGPADSDRRLIELANGTVIDGDEAQRRIERLLS
jgi:hypothetical protein